MIAKENSSNDAISEKWRAGCSPSAVHVVCSQWDSADRHTPRNGRKEVFWWLGPCGLHVQTPRISPALLSVLSPWKGIKQRPLLYEAQHQVGSVLWHHTRSLFSRNKKRKHNWYKSETNDKAHFQSLQRHSPELLWAQGSKSFCCWR